VPPVSCQLGREGCGHQSGAGGELGSPAALQNTARSQSTDRGTANYTVEEVNHELCVYGQQSLNALEQAQLFWDSEIL
ncbi:hypothetical protein EK904_007101, partial [Melospiza melodia maxima]